MTWYDYDLWEPTDLSNWPNPESCQHEHEQDPHLDIGCGTVKKGRIGIDRYGAPGVNVVMDLETLFCAGRATEPNSDDCSWRDENPYGFPFADSSIQSAITHEVLEHVGEGFIPLMDEIYRVLVPGGVLRVIVPLFPSRNAVEDPDHCRYFMEGTMDAFGGHLGDENNPTGSWLDSFSVPYTKARFGIVDKTCTPLLPLALRWGEHDVRGMRVSMLARK